MSLFQSLALSLLALLAISTLLWIRSVGWRRSVGYLWLAVWFAAGMAILRPELTTKVAKALGIQRGADLVLYSAVLGGLMAFFWMQSQIRRLRREVTEVTRALALQKPLLPPASPSKDSPSGDSEASGG
jgi:hypothetical protein